MANAVSNALSGDYGVIVRIAKEAVKIVEFQIAGKSYTFVTI
jgi:hypothetical protein